MKILFVSLNASLTTWYVDNKEYWTGNNHDLPELMIKEFRNKRVDEHFSYSISTTHIEKLCRSILKTDNVKTKIDLLLKTYTEASREITFEGGEGIVFKVIPESQEEFLFYNSKFIEYHIRITPRCSFDRLLSEFKIKKTNTPNYKLLEEIELQNIKDTIKHDYPVGIAKWYNLTNGGHIPKDKTAFELFISKLIEPNIIVYLQGKALAEYYSFLESSLVIRNKSEVEYTTLQQLFKSPEEYVEIMALLVKEKLCQEETFIWIDSESGWKSSISAIIKYLHSKGYLIRKPKNSEIELIIRNTFGVKVSKETYKPRKRDVKDSDSNAIPILKLIPISKSL